MSFNISSFSNVIGTGTRANLFSVEISGVIIGQESNFKTLAKATSIPSSTVGLIEIPYAAGRRLKVSGDRTFADWTVTLMSDSAFSLRTALENYQNNLVFLDATSDGVGNRGIGNRATLTVKQLADNGTTVLRTYTLKNAFPTDISTIDLSYDSRDTIEEFTVTWAYEYYSLS